MIFFAFRGGIILKLFRHETYFLYLRGGIIFGAMKSLIIGRELEQNKLQDLYDSETAEF